jgi:formylglycine-generating enzyme required for sulfatase activity
MVDSPDRVNKLSLVTWLQATSVVAKTGGWLCLPTSAQWEYGTRAGTKTRWWPGNDVQDLEGAAHLLGGNGWRIGEGRANPFGLHDTLGGVAEWCCDGPFDKAPARPGDGRRSSTSYKRWHRGGNSGTPSEALNTGFRPAEPGAGDYDGDGDEDHVDEESLDLSPALVGLRLARPLLR